MKTHLKIASVFTALFLGLSSNFVIAQQEPPPPPPSEAPGCRPPPQEHFLKMLTEKLSLTDNQQATIKVILEDEKTAMDVLRESAQSTDRETMRSQVETIRKSYRAKIREALTADQQKIFDQLKPERRGPPPPPPGE